jgi:hypothetical protein
LSGIRTHSLDHTATAIGKSDSGDVVLYLLNICFKKCGQSDWRCGKILIFSAQILVGTSAILIENLSDFTQPLQATPAMNLRVPYNSGKFLISCKIGAF